MKNSLPNPMFPVRETSKDRIRRTILSQLPIEESRTDEQVALRTASKSTSSADIVKVSQMIIDLHIVQRSAKSSHCDSQPVRSAEASELAAAFEVRFKLEKDASNAEFVHPLTYLGQVDFQI